MGKERAVQRGYLGHTDCDCREQIEAKSCASGVLRTDSLRAKQNQTKPTKQTTTPPPKKPQSHDFLWVNTPPYFDDQRFAISQNPHIVCSEPL